MFTFTSCDRKLLKQSEKPSARPDLEHLLDKSLTINTNSIILVFFYDAISFPLAPVSLLGLTLDNF